MSNFDYKTTNMGTVLLDEEFCKERRLEEKHNRRKVGGLQNSKYNLDIYKYDLVPGPLRWLQLYNYIYNLKGIQCICMRKPHAVNDSDLSSNKKD